MTKVRKTREEVDLEYIKRLEALKTFIANTPADDMPNDKDLGRMFNTSAYSCNRARHMIETGCSAEEAVSAIRLKSTKEVRPGDTLASESMSGHMSLEFLTQKWCRS